LSFSGFDDSQTTEANEAGRSGKNNKISNNLIYNSALQAIAAGTFPTVRADITGTRIEYNEVYENGASGREAIGLGNAHGGTITKNDVHDNYYMGILIYDSEFVKVDHNEVYDNADPDDGYGIWINLSNAVRVERNLVYDNAHQGIWIDHSSQVAVKNNDTINNGFYGIAIWDSEEIDVVNNRADNNISDGILLWRSTGGAFKYNTAKNNTKDVEWDEFGSFTFKWNVCQNAVPSKEAWDCREPKKGQRRMGVYQNRSNDRKRPGISGSSWFTGAVHALDHRKK